jgi:hypothetical protein
MGGHGGSGGKGGVAANERVDVAQACHEIIDAVSSLVINLEFLANKNKADQQIVDDVRKSIDRVVELARAIQSAVETKPSGSSEPT